MTESLTVTSETELNITIPTEAGSIKIEKDSVTFNLQVEYKSGSTIKVPLKITESGIELEASNTITDDTSKVKTTYSLKQKGVDMYLSINQYIEDTWSNNNINNYYKAYAECGVKLDYDNTNRGLSYETALAYATAESAEVVYQVPTEDGIIISNNKSERDWAIFWENCMYSSLIFGGIVLMVCIPTPIDDALILPTIAVISEKIK